MKKVFSFLALSTLLFSRAEPMKPHTPAAGENFCSYNAQGAGNGTFRVCVFCPSASAKCGTLKDIKVHREDGHYDYYTLTAVGTMCDTCTGVMCIEKE